MQPRCVAVAYSGGRDSTALLRATLAVAGPLGIEVIALHVNHGLSAFADAWQGACEAQCGRWARAGRPIRFEARRLTTKPRRGDSVEAWAREARYRALREMAKAHGATLVLLAHHRRDQAETLLLQALRGAGVAGLAGMPAVVTRDGITWARPWLAQPRNAIDAYARRYRLRAIEDDSNADPRYARNRVRLGVWPALLKAFPQAEASLASAATWAQQALVCLDELAVHDLARTSDAKGLDIEAWQDLSEARRSLVLRAWLRRECGPVALSSLAGRLLRELGTGRSARWPAGDGELRCHRGRLAFHPMPSMKASQAAPEDHLRVQRAGRYALPGWHGALRFTRVREGGVPLAWLAQLDLRVRSGGERFQAGLGRPPRSLKLQFQAAGVPAWQREGPLVYAGGQLVFVPGLGIDARVIGMPGQPQVMVAWEADGTP